MPRIIPIRDLKDTAKISELCHASDKPVFITKNGYGDMVIMSMKTYEEQLWLNDAAVRLAEAEQDISEGKVSDAEADLRELREKYGI